MILVILVTAIAVNGSRAQALSATSVAFDQCLGHARSAERCSSLGSRVGFVEDSVGAIETGAYGDSGLNGGDLGDHQVAELSNPELWQEIFVHVLEAFLLAVARRAAERVHIGGTLPIMLDARLSQ